MDTGPITVVDVVAAGGHEPLEPRARRDSARLRERRAATAGRRLVAPLPLLGICIVVAHLPYLLGWFDSNPLLQESALGIDLRPGLLPGKDTIDPNAGFTSQALAHRAALDWLHGRLPWWNPFEGVGDPLAAELQCAALFPLVLILALSNGQVYLYLLLCLVAAYSTYFLLSRLSLAPWASFAGAVAFGLNGTFSWMRFAPSNPVCFLPLVLLGVELARGRTLEDRRAPWWIIGFGVGLSILAGFPETAYIDGLLVLLWTLVRLSGLSRRQARRYLAATAAGTASGLLLAAPLLVAFADYLPHASLANNGGDLSHTYLPAQGAATLLFPYAFGPIWGFTSGSGGITAGNIWGGTGGYLTVALVLLAVFGLIGRGHRGLKVALAVWSVLLVGRSYGISAFADGLAVVPGLEHAVTSRFMDPSLSMAVVTLAAFGVADLLEARTPRKQLLYATAVVSAVALAAAVSAYGLANTVRGVTPWWVASFVWAAATVALVTAIVITSRFRRLAMVLAVVLLPTEALAMFIVPELSAPRSGQIDQGLVSFMQSHIGADRFTTLGPFSANYGSYFGVAEINQNDLPLPKDFSRLITTDLDSNAIPVLFTGATPRDPNGLSPEDAFDRHARTFAALGVKYLLVRPVQPLPHPRGVRLTVVYHDPMVTVYQLAGVADFFTDRTPGCAPQMVSEVEVRVDCNRVSTLVRDELVMPGWTAQVDGHTLGLRPTRLFQESLRLPPGRHTVSYRFAPPHIDLTWPAALLGLLAYPLAGLLSRRRSRRE